VYLVVAVQAATLPGFPAITLLLQEAQLAVHMAAEVAAEPLPIPEAGLERQEETVVQE
jgi:hypothetical protein